MSRFDDYEAEMQLTTLSDSDIGLLLSGVVPDSEAAAQLVVFIDLIRAESAGEPSATMVQLSRGKLP